MKATRHPHSKVVEPATSAIRVVALSFFLLLFPLFFDAVQGSDSGHFAGAALAKSGSGSDGDSGGHGGDDGGDSGPGGGDGDNSGSSDHDGDDGDDDNGGNNGGSPDRNSGSGAGAGGKAQSQSSAWEAASASRASGARQISISQRGIQVTYNNGGRTEIENGTYTFRGKSGQLLVRRTATGADIALVKSIIRGFSVERLRSSEWVAVRPVRFKSTRVLVRVVYSNGWTEQVRKGQYSLKDNLGRVIVTRPSTNVDRARLMQVVEK